jgi:CHAT domain-containing protein/tetratricopeptide (TPR) repeat protein
MDNSPNLRTRLKRTVTFALVLVLISVTADAQRNPESIARLYAQGLFDQIAARGPSEVERLMKAGRIVEAAQASSYLCRTYIQLGRFDAAIELVDRIAPDRTLRENSRREAANLYFCKASVYRRKQEFPLTLDNIKLALSLAPNDSATLASYYLEVGRTLFSAGHDFSAILWFEKAESLALAGGHTTTYQESLRFLSLSWSAKHYQAKAIAYSEKLIEASSRVGYEHRNRVAHLELANMLDATGQPRKATNHYLTGLSLSFRAGVDEHSGQFLTSLLLRSLYENDIPAAQKYLQQLELIDKRNTFSFGRFLGRALVENYKGNRLLSEEYFSKLAKEQASSDFLIPYWKSTIAERDKNWKELINHSETLRRLTEEVNYRDDLPGIYYKLALGFWRSGDERSAREFASKALGAFEPFRSSNAPSLSIGMMEVNHSIYRLLSEMESEQAPIKAFEYSERLKAKVLRDRIERSALRPQADLSETLRAKLFSTSKDFVDGRTTAETLNNLEKQVVTERQAESHMNPDFSVGELKLPNDTSVISYQFTPSGSLLAFIIEPGTPLRVVKLGLGEEQISQLADETRSKINARIFFKSDGKRIFDLLLKPLELKSRHFAIVPDKLLWRIPFQALSPDGSKYLIETNTISYSPSVYLLKQSLSSEPPRRKTIAIFANDTFNNQRLAHVNDEAKSIGGLFGTAPVIRSTRKTFMRSAADADILHFSMHAQLASEDPLSSFLALAPGPGDSGKFTVNDLLALRLKPGSLAFLASCDTSKVHNGEGLISIPWAMLGSGSSSVISAHWEAPDKSTRAFVLAFYAEYLKNQSTSTALQRAAVSLIQDKDQGFHEPYFWALFGAMGDFR